MVKATDQVFPTESHVAMNGGIELRTWLAAKIFATHAGTMSEHSLRSHAAYCVIAADTLIEELNK